MSRRNYINPLETAKGVKNVRESHGIWGANIYVQLTHHVGGQLGISLKSRSDLTFHPRAAKSNNGVVSCLEK